MADSKIDPFDVAALEKSLNDSASRVSTIWVSFLVFSLYLLTAAATVTHRQLFLAEPLKLPVLNIDLPIWGFFFLAPILFVILHTYVLLQVILLARTAAAYNKALKKVAERDRLSTEETSSLGQRLANTLFAQIFAGSPREREGAFGRLLKAMAWITLAISPILILFAFQFTFLPYHSHLATWTHRLLILLEFILAFQLWPLALDPQRDFRWPDWRGSIRETAQHLRGLRRSHKARRVAWRGLRPQAILLAAGVTFVMLSLLLASFPGEPHVNVLTGRSSDAVECKGWTQRTFGVDLQFDRVSLARVTIVDHEKLQKIEQATAKAGEQPYQGERTRILRSRDFNCGDFSDYADLRRIDLSGAHLRNANFDLAKLAGASLAGAHLQGASFRGAQLQGASLYHAQLQGAYLPAAELQEAFLIGAQLQGASLDHAQLQGALLGHAKLQGASLELAKFQGASLIYAELQGASLNYAWLHGTQLGSAELQGASLIGAKLQGASFNHTLLQGSSLEGANLSFATMPAAWIWRTRGADCTKMTLAHLRFDAVLREDFIELGQQSKQVPATPSEIEKFIAQSITGIPEKTMVGLAQTPAREAASKRMRQGLIADSAMDDTAALAEVWRRCQAEPPPDFEAGHIAELRNIVCNAEDHEAAIGEGVVRGWISTEPFQGEFHTKLAQALLGEDGTDCAAAKHYRESTRRLLRATARRLPSDAGRTVM